MYTSRFYNQSMSKTDPRLITADRARSSEAGKKAINDALDLFQRRWALKIIWELSKRSTCTFRDLQQACDNASASVLNVRLAELRSAMLVEHNAGDGYRLTGQGEALMIAVAPLLQWAPQWARAVARSSE